MQIEWTKVWAVVITGLVVVFLALVLLIGFVTLFGMIFGNMGKKSNDKKNGNKTTDNSPKPAVTNVVKETPAPVQSEDDNIIAVISAAVAMLAAKDGKNYAVKSIKRAVSKTRSTRSVWGAAGQCENTRPF